MSPLPSRGARVGLLSGTAAATVGALSNALAIRLVAPW